MAGSRYSQTIDLENWNSSHSLAVLSVPAGSRVLHLGSIEGSVALALKGRGCAVWGIEVNEGVAEAASHGCDRVIVADLEADDAFDALRRATFDVILALDVLEHLRDPASVLKRATDHLTSKGIAIVSVPNVTHAALRVSLLAGRFNYTEQGLLDRRHLRFFDRVGAERLISDAGLSISQHLRVRRELDETEIAIDKTGVPAELLERLAHDPDATTYQFVFVAGRENGLPQTATADMLSERLLAEHDGLLRQFRKLEAHAKDLQEQLARAESSQSGKIAELLETGRERDELRNELGRRTQEAHQMNRDLKHCKADLSAKEAFIVDLRQQLLPMKSLVSERDQLLEVKERLSARIKQSATRREELIEERRRLLARQAEFDKELRALRAYTNSAGFWLVEGVIRRLRSFPKVFTIAKGMVRRIAGRKDVKA